MSAGSVSVSERRSGAHDLLLGHFVGSHRDIQQARLAASQRGLDALAAQLQQAEDMAAKEIGKILRAHPIWPWLSQYRGLGGVHSARLIDVIGDPRRFPGQQCSLGHTIAPDFGPGDPCPAVGKDDEPCEGVMLAPRSTTGVRALWRYLGLHVVEGRSPRRMRGQRASWNAKGRTALLQPGGLAEQIVRHRPDRYRAIYDEAKERLIRERGVGVDPEIGHACGSALPETPEPEAAGWQPVIGLASGRLGHLDHIARVIAVKAFVADLLTEWKRLVAVEIVVVVGSSTGGDETLTEPAEGKRGIAMTSGGLRERKRRAA